MYSSSPGGIALQDYHWSGGFYSPNFLYYDKWGQSLPRDLYGFNGSVSEMIPKRAYDDKLTQHQILVKNYELLNSTPVPRKTHVDTHKIHKIPKKTQNLYEKYDSGSDPLKSILLFVLFFFAVYLFDKTFEEYIRETNIYIKIISLVIVCFLIYMLLEK